MPIKHAFVSAKDDGGDATLVRPSNWNADHEGLEIVRKTADELVNNSEILQNDNHLVLAVGANDIWQIFLHLKHISATTTPDLDYAFTVPSGGSIKAGIVSIGDGDASIVPYDFTAEHTIPAFDTERWTVVYMLYIGGGTAGNLQLQWAQNIATEEDTKVLTNSFMLCHQIA